eukprot:s207_g11.t1
MCLPLQSWLLEVHVPTVVMEVRPTVAAACFLEVYVASGHMILGRVPAVVVKALGSVPAVVLGRQTTVVLEMLPAVAAAWLLKAQSRLFEVRLPMCHGSGKCTYPTAVWEIVPAVVTVCFLEVSAESGRLSFESAPTVVVCCGHGSGILRTIVIKVLGSVPRKWTYIVVTVLGSVPNIVLEVHAQMPGTSVGTTPKNKRRNVVAHFQVPGGNDMMVSWRAVSTVVARWFLEVLATVVAAKLTYHGGRLALGSGARRGFTISTCTTLSGPLCTINSPVLDLAIMKCFIDVIVDVPSFPFTEIKQLMQNQSFKTLPKPYGLAKDLGLGHPFRIDLAVLPQEGGKFTGDVNLPTRATIIRRGGLFQRAPSTSADSTVEQDHHCVKDLLHKSFDSDIHAATAVTNVNDETPTKRGSEILRVILSLASGLIRDVLLLCLCS